MKITKLKLLIFIISVCALSIIPILIKSIFIIRLIVYMFVYLILAESWSIAGYRTGLVSLGHSAFFGLGAYFFTFLVLWFNILPFMAVPLSGCLVSVLAMVIGQPCLKLKTEYLAIGTLCLTEIMRIIFVNWKEAGGTYGITFPLFHYNIWLIYYMSLIYTIVTVLLMHKIRNSKFGKALIAIREDELAAATVGVPAFEYKIAVFGLSSLFAAVAGAIYTYSVQRVDPYFSFDIKWTSLPIIVAIIGGESSLGMAVFSFVYAFVFERLLTTYSAYGGIIFGLLLIVIFVYFPKGIYDLYVRVKDSLRLLTRRHRLR